MLGQLPVTPCPPRASPCDDARRSSILSIISSDTVANLDYTTEFKALFRDTKPRRRPANIAKANRKTIVLTIHEDDELQVYHSAQEKHEVRDSDGPPMQRNVVLQPAHRPQDRVSFVSPPQNDEVDLAPVNPPQTVAKTRRRASLQTSRTTIASRLAEDQTLPRVPSPKIAMPARRGTIYIPTDDTTMPTIYMGIFSPLNPGSLEAGQEAGSGMTGLAAQMARKKPLGSSVLEMSPRRAPLKLNTQALRDNAPAQVRAGQGPGKENIPPGHAMNQQPYTAKKASKSILPKKKPTLHDSLAQRGFSRLLNQTASSSARAHRDQKSSKSVNKPVWNSGPKLPQAVVLKRERTPSKTLLSEPPQQVPVGQRVPTRFFVPNVEGRSVLERYPLLPEGVRDASMYEESWLAQQEVAITQLINNLFGEASPFFTQGRDGDLLRLKLLEHYNSPEMALLYKRVQSAVSYGALGISKDTIASGHRLWNDLAYRGEFVSLWLETYDNYILLAALEVVMGRLLSCRADGRSDQNLNQGSSRMNCRALRQAIETLLIRNDDSNPNPEVGDPVSWCYRRTMLRSLMLIKSLDLVKTTKDFPSTTKLFQSTSAHKSSKSVLQQLVRMVNPGVGDPLRPLQHLGYSLTHSQYPLEEYSYEIQNLAVDLRDGVRLTRLVELLLYRSATHTLEYNHGSGATLTLATPTAEVLSLTEGHEAWPLSQHLKFPCLSRATKLYNTQIALCALSNVKGMNSVFQDISADDIVDGYREKTVRLLWALTSKWGLGGLVDWEDLKKETKRLGRFHGKLGDWYEAELDFDEEDSGYIRFKTLLKGWVKAVAGAHGLVVRNFTTSFADGRIFEAIVDEYQPYLLGIGGLASKCSIASRLRNLRCSDQFIRLFEKSAGRGNEHIFDRDFVLASLAFLCSRLLGPSKRARAAVAIQRGWRQHWDRVINGRKSVLQTLAASCAARVQGDETRGRAKATIWRAWRSYNARKQERAVVGGGSSISLQDSSNDEEDIWLSLR